MIGKKKYYLLEDIGIIGTQEKKSPAAQRYHRKKTGEAIRQLREGANMRRVPKSHVKKA